MALPSAVLEVATQVSTKLAREIDRRKKSSAAFAIARRRKLILNLKETLVQARDGPMEGVVLASWLRKLQEEFVVRMFAIDEEAKKACAETSEEADGSGGGEQQDEGEQESGSRSSGEAEVRNGDMTDPEDEICLVPTE